MLREVKWSPRAIHEWVEILEYWKNRNKSDTYSLKLDRLIQEALDRIAKSPEHSKATDESPLVRVKIFRDYLIYYRIQPEYIDILAIWDSRRNPKKFKL